MTIAKYIYNFTAIATVRKTISNLRAMHVEYYCTYTAISLLHNYGFVLVENRKIHFYLFGVIDIPNA